MNVLVDIQVLTRASLELPLSYLLIFQAKIRHLPCSYFRIDFYYTSPIIINIIGKDDVVNFVILSFFFNAC